MALPSSGTGLENPSSTDPAPRLKRKYVRKAPLPARPPRRKPAPAAVLPPSTLLPARDTAAAEAPPGPPTPPPVSTPPRERQEPPAAVPAQPPVAVPPEVLRKLDAPIVLKLGATVYRGGFKLWQRRISAQGIPVSVVPGERRSNEAAEAIREILKLWPGAWVKALPVLHLGFMAGEDIIDGLEKLDGYKAQAAAAARASGTAATGTAGTAAPAASPPPTAESSPTVPASGLPSDVIAGGAPPPDGP